MLLCVVQNIKTYIDIQLTCNDYSNELTKQLSYLGDMVYNKKKVYNWEESRVDIIRNLGWQTIRELYMLHTRICNHITRYLTHGYVTCVCSQFKVFAKKVLIRIMLLSLQILLALCRPLKCLSVLTKLGNGTSISTDF